jgi:hypothetical protein
MKVTELDKLMIDLLVADDHPEIVRVENLSGGDNPKTYHPRVKIHYANGGSTTIQVFRVTGPKIPNAPKYTVPSEAL